MAYPLGRTFIAPLYRLWLRKAEGIENVPAKGPYIIAANHASYYDALLIPSIIAPRIEKKIHALVHSYYWKPFITRFFLNLWKAIPVHVEKEENYKEKNREATAKAINYLRNRELIMIFPEGTRSYDGKLKKAYAGVARLALKAKVPVLPVGITGSSKVLPREKMLPRFKRCDVKFGKLMHFDKYYGKKQNEKTFENITRQIMKNIAKLIGQKYNY